MDLGFYYQNDCSSLLGSSLSNYTTLTTHYVDMGEVDKRIDLLESSNARISTQIVTQISQLSNININVGNLTEDTSFKLKDLVDPIVQVGMEFGSDFMKYWLDKNDVKDKLFDFVNKQLGNDLFGNADKNNDGIFDAPDITTDFRKLVNNPFTPERTLGFTNGYGLGLCTDLNLSDDITVNCVSSNQFEPSDFGTNYKSSMSTAKKVPIISVASLSATLSNLTLHNRLQTNNLQVFNSSTLKDASAITFFANTTSSLSNTTWLSTSSNLRSSNASISDSLVVTGKNVLLENSPAFVSQLDVSNGDATIGVDGSASVYKLNVNGSTFEVRPSGDVFVNGKWVIDGTKNECVVYEDSIRSLTQRYKVSDVMAGNIGSTDSYVFDNLQPAYPTETTGNPLSFTTLANRNQMLQTLQNFSTGSWMLGLD